LPQANKLPQLCYLHIIDFSTKMSLPTESLAGKHDLKLVSEDASEVILATAGYDHTIKFWQAHTGACVLTLQHPDSHVNAMEISPDGQVMKPFYNIRTCAFSFLDQKY